MMTESTRKQDGRQCFDLTEWLTHDVKLPQYRDTLLVNGFESPLECSNIDEAVLDALEIVKIGHRRRLLVSCQKLADKYNIALSNDLPKTDDSIEAKEQQTIIANNVQSRENLEIPPSLPPKKGKKVKPAPPERNIVEQEVNMSIDGVTKDETLSDADQCLAQSHLYETLEVSEPMNSVPNLIQKESVKVGNDRLERVHESTCSESSRPALPLGNEILEYEPMWEASEGVPLPLTPSPLTSNTTSTQLELLNNNVNLDVIDTDEKINIIDDKTNGQINKECKQDATVSVSGPPPIPPRADLEDAVKIEKPVYANVPMTEIAPKPFPESVPISVTDELPASTTGLKPTPITGGTPTPNTGITPSAMPIPSLSPKSNPSDLNPPEQVVLTRKKVAPMKPPRRGKNKPVSMFIPQNQDAVLLPTPRRSVGSIEQAGKERNDVIYENEVFTNLEPEKGEENEKSTEEERSLSDCVPAADIPMSDENDIYGNAESFKKAPVQSTLSQPILGREGNRKPIPVPRTRSLERLKRVEDVYDEIPGKWRL